MLKMEYDGTNYHGWQRQENAITVQETLEKALKKITKEEITVIGCSRTDAGVHALGYVCNFHTSSKIPAEKMPYALNSVLPEDIVVYDCREVPRDFHARFWAKGKKYRYRIYNGKYPSAFERNYAYYWPYTLDVECMKEAAKLFIGEHDFRAFMATGSRVKDTVRNVFDLSVEKKGDEIIIEISANGFLYNMVRIIAGTLLYAGVGKIDVERIEYIIKTGDRKEAGITAAPQGLYLVEVYY
ncbi:MAG: tRNA pseudouridine(38-40) synthase TruA [Clostridiaceae bacterium]|nr:tRNA pseudouridine(38-40) synthase TruA [Clostridiaceae bacterium]